MPTKDVPFIVRDLGGLNRRDGADRIQNNEFYRTQNLYPASKGLLYKRFGTTSEQASFPGASRVSGIHRHYAPNKEKFTLYHCEPDSTNLADNTTDLTLTEISGGDLFGGGAVETMRFCYSWVGLGLEQTYNSKGRAGFVSLPIDAWNQVGHQSIVVSSNSKGVQVGVPAFPAGVVAANVFAARGVNTQMTYVGTVVTSSGTLDVTHYIGPEAANGDPLGTVTAGGYYDASGTLKPGTYYITLAWVTDPVQKEGQAPNAISYTSLAAAQSVIVETSQNAITVEHSLASSTNGAQATYVFLGTKTETQAPMLCVGIMKASETFIIRGFQDSNAQSHPDFLNGVGATGAFFDQSVKAAPFAIQARFGFILKKNDAGVLSELLPSRTIETLSTLLSIDPIYGSVNSTGGYSSLWYLGHPRTGNDKYGMYGGPLTQPFVWGRRVYDPNFAYFNGLSYFVNGFDIPWQTDGFTLGQIVRLSGTRLPPYPRFISVFESSLLVAGAEAKNLVFSCNANQPQNWSAGGTGTAMRFVAIGDLFGDECTALGVFSYSTDAVNDPRSFFVSFKKNASWMKDAFPDPSSGIGSPMQELSGRVGCTAYRSIVSTPMGLMFLGSDGMIYLIRGGTNPRPVGGRVQALFTHLQSNDSLSQLVTAVFHDNHYKISYPSSSSSTYNDAQIWADLRTEDGDNIRWFGPHTGINVGAQIVLSGESDDMSRIACRSDAVQTVKLDDQSTYQDLGTNISSVAETKTWRFGAEMNLKRYMGAVLDAFYDTQFNNTITVEFFSDDQYAVYSKTLSTTGAVYDTSNFDAGFYSDALYQAFPAMIGDTNLVGRMLKVRVTHSDASPFILSAIGIPYKPERRQIV